MKPARASSPRGRTISPIARPIPSASTRCSLILARGAAADRQYTTAYNIARQVDDGFAPGTDITLKSYGIRDDYTTLTWLAGTQR